MPRKPAITPEQARYDKTLGAKIREARENKALNQEEIAKLADYKIKQKQLSRIELGQKRTSVYELSIISKALNIPARKLIP